MGVVGASGFRAAATLANTQGIAAQSSGLLDNIKTNLLDAGRRINKNSFGLSKGARANLKRLQDSSAEFNTLFSLSGGGSSNVESAQKQILALRSSAGQLSREVRGDALEIPVDTAETRAAAAEALANDDGGVAASDTGANVDTEA